MPYLIVLVAVVGFGLGGFVVWALLEGRRRELTAVRAEAEAEREKGRESLALAAKQINAARARLMPQAEAARVRLEEMREQIRADEAELDDRKVSLEAQLGSTRRRHAAALQEEFRGLRERIDEAKAELQQRTAALETELDAKRRRQTDITAAAAKSISEQAAALRRDAAALEQEREVLDKRAVTVTALTNENRILKRDALNLDTAVRKSRLDDRARAEAQTALEERAGDLAARYLAEVEKWVASSINANNYAACKQRLVKAIAWSRGIGFDVPAEREELLLATLKSDYELAVRAALEREEQARIKARIKEEQQREKDIQRELEAAARERDAVRFALERALAEARDAHGAEIDHLRARLSEAEARNQRAISQAQLTRAGHIYVISNLGSFGDSVYKIGMTRRLDPKDRVAELGDASVPFPYDVHMMISCDDAPSLENALHREFHGHRVNKVNPRKEFFRIDLDRVRRFVEERHGEVRFVADAEALQYRQSVNMNPEDQAYIEGVFDDAERKVGVADAED